MTGASMRTVLIAIAVSGVMTGFLQAQEKGSQPTREFVAEAAQSDTFEKMEAYSALAESRDPQVIAFANQILRDHGTTSASLAAATAKAQLDPPPIELNTGQAAFLAALQSARGETFDRLYWRQQALGHRSALTVEQRYAATGDMPPLRDAARQAIPVIEAHLAMAERMTLGAGGE